MSELDVAKHCDRTNLMTEKKKVLFMDKEWLK